MPRERQREREKHTLRQHRAESQDLNSHASVSYNQSSWNRAVGHKRLLRRWRPPVSPNDQVNILIPISDLNQFVTSRRRRSRGRCHCTRKFIHTDNWIHLEHMNVWLLAAAAAALLIALLSRWEGRTHRTLATYASDSIDQYQQRRPRATVLSLVRMNTRNKQASSHIRTSLLYVRVLLSSDACLYILDGLLSCVLVGWLRVHGLSPTNLKNARDQVGRD